MSFDSDISFVCVLYIYREHVVWQIYLRYLQKNELFVYFSVHMLEVKSAENDGYCDMVAPDAGT